MIVRQFSWADDGTAATHTETYPSGDYELTVLLHDGGGLLLASVTEVVKVYDTISATLLIELLGPDLHTVPTAPSGLLAAAALPIMTWAGTRQSQSMSGVGPTSATTT